MADTKQVAVAMPEVVRAFDLATGLPSDDRPYTEGIDAANAEISSLLSHSELRIQFPKAADGRGYSLALRLREAGFAGRIVATGDLHAEMAYHLRRSGFNAMELDASRAPASLSAEQRHPFHAAYQRTIADQAPATGTNG